MLQKVYRVAEVIENFHRGSKSKLYADIQSGKFPRPDVRISERIPGWTEATLEAHQTKQREAALVAGRAA